MYSIHLENRKGEIERYVFTKQVVLVLTKMSNMTISNFTDYNIQ